MTGIIYGLFRGLVSGWCVGRCGAWAKGGKSHILDLVILMDICILLRKGGNAVYIVYSS